MLEELVLSPHDLDTPLSNLDSFLDETSVSAWDVSLALALPLSRLEIQPPH